MASSKTWANICPECGKHVDILNGDVEFSMDLHNQSHKSLEYVNAIDRNLNYSKEKIDNDSKLKLNHCHDCNESFEIINNDLSLSFQLHAQKHKLDNAETLSDHSSASSSKSKVSQNSVKNTEPTQPSVNTILDAIFHTLPPGLQAHQHFVSELTCSKAICNLCELTIDPIFSLSEHLKTKLHEDNSIKVIKAILPSELHDQMEFISFYGSNLCCNLCRCKIDLCSENLYKTTMNIFIHNAGKGHLSKKTVNKASNQSDNIFLTMKNLALINPLMDENLQFIEHKLNPHIKCKPCDKPIVYSENQNELLNNFTDHFNSQSHLNYLNAVSLLTKWSTLKIIGKENHDFCVSKQNICCLSCNCDVETNLDQLLFHVRKSSALYGKMQTNSVPGEQGMNKTVNSVFQEANMSSKFEEVQTKQPPVAQPSQTKDTSMQFKRLINSLPIQLRNIITENEKGCAVCSVCKCTIPATTYNITTHLNGNSHKKKQNEVKAQEHVNFSQASIASNDQAKITPFMDLLASQHPLVRANKEYFVKCNSENKYICMLCGVFMNYIHGDVNSFQKNIVSHIESQEHRSKIRLKSEISQLLPKHRDTLVRELFDKIPISFQKYIKCIKAPEGENFVFCEICFIKIPRHRNCLLEHLESTNHESSIKRFAGMQTNTAFEGQVDKADALFEELLKSNKHMKANAKYLNKGDDDYFCKICKAVIKHSYDPKLLEVNFLSHLTGKTHSKKVEHEFDKILEKLALSSTIVKSNWSFLKKEGNILLCTVCPCKMSIADSVDVMLRNLEEHFSGFSHKQQLGKVVTSSHSSLPTPDTGLSTIENEMTRMIL